MKEVLYEKHTHWTKTDRISGCRMIMIPGSAIPVMAAEEMEEEQSIVPAAGIESVLEECYQTEVKDNINLYMVPADEGEYLNRAFSDTDDFTYIRSCTG